MDGRTAAYIAVTRYLQMGVFIEETLTSLHLQLQKSEFRLAHEISFGTTRQALALDYIATKLNEGKPVSLKKKERALLRTALYQAAFMDRMPLYAIVDSTVEIAKKFLHPTIGRFFNALLRKLEQGIPILPTQKNEKDLAIRYSLPEPLIHDFTHTFGEKTALEIFRLSNKVSPTFYRDRSKPVSPSSFLDLNTNNELDSIIQSNRFYIQNPTPIALVEFLAQNTPLPRTILDLCAAPGGKLLAAHDLYPEAILHANDLSEEKLAQIKHNCQKFNMHVHLTKGRGELYPSTQKFDLIILDVPCSNTGVLNKRPEARWRYQSETLQGLAKTQESLLSHALELVNPGGAIWYMTCSIVPKENEDVIKKVCGKLPQTHLTILPNAAGMDGGFGCLIKKDDL